MNDYPPLLLPGGVLFDKSINYFIVHTKYIHIDNAK